MVLLKVWDHDADHVAMSMPMWIRRLTAREVTGLLIVVALLVVGALAQPSGDDEPPSASDSRRIGWGDASATAAHAHEVFGRVNDERLARGSPPLQWSSDLADMAERWSEEMISSGEFEHSTGEYRAHPRFVATGENIAIEPRGTREAHVGLMRSEGHRHAILDPDFDEVGIGMICRNDGVMWVTQIFGRQEAHRPRARVNLAEEPIVRDDRGLSCP